MLAGHAAGAAAAPNAQAVLDGETLVMENKMPCYRKDDRAMRPIAYLVGLKIFGSPWIAMPI